MLDEPATKQSDPAILNLQLRQMSKSSPGAGDVAVSRIEQGDEQKHKKLAAWIQNVATVQQSKPPASVSYSKPMPDIEELMQEWPPEMEAALRNMRLPAGDTVSSWQVVLRNAPRAIISYNSEFYSKPLRLCLKLTALSHLRELTLAEVEFPYFKGSLLRNNTQRCRTSTF